MTRIDRSVMFNSLVLSLVLYPSWIQICYSSSKVDPAEIAPKSFNECGVCKELANKLYNQYDSKRKDLQKKEQSKCVTEISKIVCNLAQAVEQGDTRKPVKRDLKGQCDSESKTIEESCLEKVIGVGNPRETALFVCGNNPTEMDSLDKHLCTKACIWTVPGGVRTSEKKVKKKKVNLKQKCINVYKNTKKLAIGLLCMGQKEDNDLSMHPTMQRDLET